MVTFNRINSTFYKLNNCEIGQVAKYCSNPLKLELNITPTARRPFPIIDSIPRQIMSDNGLEFKNELHKIRIRCISSQHPESNDLIERFHSTLIKHIR